MRRKGRVEELLSAGGVVYRIRDQRVEVVICGRSSPVIWGLPKGTPDAGETREQTALREVNEETGLEVRTEGLIDSIDYWFARSADRVRLHKTVFFYLMSAHGGGLSLHDHEFDVVNWCPAEEACETLTYENEVRIVKKGLSMVSNDAG